jgi:hypothetical protein
MEALSSSETSVLARATPRSILEDNIPEDGILHIHRRENLKSYLIILRLSLDHSVFEWRISDSYRDKSTNRYALDVMSLANEIDVPSLPVFLVPLTQFSFPRDTLAVFSLH